MRVLSQTSGIVIAISLDGVFAVAATTQKCQLPPISEIEGWISLHLRIVQESFNTAFPPNESGM